MRTIEDCEARLADISEALRLKENEDVVDDELLRLMREKAHAMLDLAEALLYDLAKRSNSLRRSRSL